LKGFPSRSKISSIC